METVPISYVLSLISSPCSLLGSLLCEPSEVKCNLTHQQLGVADARYRC